MLRLIAAAALMLTAGCAGESYRDTSVPMSTVESVDLTRYAGRWYEIARFPVWFQDGCEAVTADYAVRPDGLVDVLNSCARDGGTDTAAATARSADPSNARLKVRFSRWIPIEGDYWIVHLDDDYETAVVGVPSGGAGWILARTPQISDERLQAAKAALTANGYDLGKLRMTAQPEIDLP
jgi:apolipoprotein D and lipocalin family protein